MEREENLVKKLQEIYKKRGVRISKSQAEEELGISLKE